MLATESGQVEGSSRTVLKVKGGNSQVGGIGIWRWVAGLLGLAWGPDRSGSCLSLGRSETVKFVARHTQNYDSLRIKDCQDVEPLWTFKSVERELFQVIEIRFLTFKVAQHLGNH